MTALYEGAPNFVPKPYAWGKFQRQDPETYFFLCDFIHMSNELPEPVQFCSKLAELHRRSTSPTGKFGFHIPTCHGRFQQAVGWDDNWESFFTKLLRAALEIDKEENSTWPEFDTIAERVLTHVIPRLLGVLQKEGRQLKPSLIHGDLWEGNVGTDFANGNIYIFDAGAYYAHHEMEIGMWRCERHKIKSKEYKRQYLRNMAISEPVEELDDRNRLYCIKMNVIHSAHHLGPLSEKREYNISIYLDG